MNAVTRLKVRLECSPAGIRAIAARLEEIAGRGAAESVKVLREAANELEGLRAFKRSVDEALNSGNGSYRP